MLDLKNYGITDHSVEEYNQLISKGYYEKVYDKTFESLSDSLSFYLEQTKDAVYDSPLFDENLKCTLAMYFRDIIVELGTLHNVNGVTPREVCKIDTETFIGITPNSRLCSVAKIKEVSLIFDALSYECFANYNVSYDSEGSARIIYVTLFANGYLFKFKYLIDVDDVLVTSDFASPFLGNCATGDQDALSTRDLCFLAVYAFIWYYNTLDPVTLPDRYDDDDSLEINDLLVQKRQANSEGTQESSTPEEAVKNDSYLELPEFQGDHTAPSRFLGHLKKLFI